MWTQLVGILFATSSTNTVDHLQHVLPDVLRDTAYNPVQHVSIVKGHATQQMRLCLPNSLPSSS